MSRTGNGREEGRSVEDILWPDEDYWNVFQKAGLALVQTYRPLAKESEPYPFVNETRIAPWVIYVLRSATSAWRYTLQPGIAA